MNRPFLLLIVSGLLLGLILCSWQAALTAFNEITGLSPPVRLWTVETPESGRIEGEFLGKKWQVTFLRQQ